MIFDTATIQSVPETLRATLRKDLDERKYPKRGALLIGGVGVGKSYALHALANHYGDKARVHNFVELVHALRSSTGTERYDELVAKITRTEIIMLDDIGAELTREWTAELVYMLINRIYERGLILYCATNLDINALRERYGDRTFSRLVALCRFVQLNGADRRVASVTKQDTCTET